MRLKIKQKGKCQVFDLSLVKVQYIKINFTKPGIDRWQVSPGYGYIKFGYF